ncbi:MAG: hypothetical protein P4L83_17840 [Nevskia sp.]|nr:hypothetical protein [Nevskia sp.]
MKAKHAMVPAWLLTLAANPIFAADHVDAPGTKGPSGDHAADITDVFLFRSNGKLVGAIDICGAEAPNARVDFLPGSYDPKVLLSYHIDTNCDGVPETDVNIRFGTNTSGQIGVQLENLPGAGATLVAGPIETVNTTPNGLRFYAGYRDDPFFFDFAGFTATMASLGDPGQPPTGKLIFNNKNDAFGQRNLTAVVFEMDLAQASGGSSNVCVWASTGRLKP